MKCLLLFFMLIAGGVTAQTTVTIVGTVHNATPDYSKNDLYQILNTTKPDLILFEFDSSLMGPEMKFRPEFLNIFEVGVIDSFLKNNTGTVVRPFDIEGRNKFFARTNYFTLEARMFGEIHRLYNADSLSPENAVINKKALALSDKVTGYASRSATVINSKEADDAIEAKMNWYHQNFPSMIRNTASLQQYEKHMTDDSSFWQNRNHAMARHILQYASLYKGKRIVVITGHYHRYYLRNLLIPNKELIIKEFYDK